MVQRIAYEDWVKTGEELFGKNPRAWKFKCPRCGSVQTMEDFTEIGFAKPQQVVHYSCIGRWKDGVGCDWTLGGLFKIHTVEILMPSGDVRPSFEYAIT